MTEIDIDKGDYLIIGSNQYAVREVEWWDMTNANTPAFQKLATEACSTKRQTIDSSGKRQSVSNASTKLSNLKCTKFDVISADLRERLGLQGLQTLRQTQISNSTGYIILVLEVPE